MKQKVPPEERSGQEAPTSEKREETRTYKQKQNEEDNESSIIK